MLNLIVAIDRQGAIGRKGDLLYHISADLKLFKAKTVGNTVIMGRRTFESLPKGALPQRRNIVVSRNKAYKAAGAEVAHSLEGALKMAESGPGEAFVIGGAELYRAALPMADVLHLTLIDAETDGADTFFPDFDPDYYELIDEQQINEEPFAVVHTLRKL